MLLVSTYASQRGGVVPSLHRIGVVLWYEACCGVDVIRAIVQGGLWWDVVGLGGT